MRISVVGISHQAAPVAVRERYAFAPAELPAVLGRLGERYDGAAVLSTCNRTEVYVADASAASLDEVIGVLNESKGYAPLEGAPFFALEGDDAVRHIFRVAAGIESMVVGESEILGQVREAFSSATAAGTHAPVISRLFHDAIRVGRRVRAQTSIGHYPVSVSSTAVALARQALGDLSRLTVLVVGAGEAGQITANSLAGSGIARMLVTSRSAQKTATLAEGLGGRAIPFDERGVAIANADIVISSTAAPGFVIDRAMVAAAMQRRPARPLLIVDIAVPRDVEPAVGEVPGVHLHDIDHVQAVADENLRLRKQEIEPALAIVDDGVRRFAEWLRAQDVIPTIAALYAKAEAMRLSELERTISRSAISPEDAARIDAMSSAIVKKLLHGPVERLHDDAEGARYARIVRDLFGLDEWPDNEAANLSS
jgi:glutamyl-tRNA reductase